MLQLIVQPCYELTGNWWVAIALFTVITKIILMPMALWVQWNSIKMVQIMPALNRLKVKHFGDRETIGEKQNELNKEKGYHPLLSLIPLAIQIIILFGLVDVVHSITDSGTPGSCLCLPACRRFSLASPRTVSTRCSVSSLAPRRT